MLIQPTARFLFIMSNNALSALLLGESSATEAEQEDPTVESRSDD